MVIILIAKKSQKEIVKYISNRYDEDILLVSNKLEVITVEDYCKWYSLFFIRKDNDNNECFIVPITHGDIICGIDHTYSPISVIEYAKINNLKIDIISYICICKRYIEDVLDEEDKNLINNRFPKYDELKSVLINAKGESKHYNLTYKKDLNLWKEFCIK